MSRWTSRHLITISYEAKDQTEADHIHTWAKTALDHSARTGLGPWNGSVFEVKSETTVDAIPFASVEVVTYKADLTKLDYHAEQKGPHDRR